jgi:uncharacterized C2H2 Zn-finger protein
MVLTQIICAIKGHRDIIEVFERFRIDKVQYVLICPRCGFVFGRKLRSVHPVDKPRSGDKSGLAIYKRGGYTAL